MKKLIALMILVLLFASLSFGQSAPYRIESMKAFLYYNHNNSGGGVNKNVVGTFSKNIFDNEGLTLFNGCNNEGCSEQIMVVVEISGHPGGYVQRKIHFKATAGNKITFEKKSEFAIIDESGRYCISYMFDSWFCDPTKLTAAIIGKGIESKIEKFIQFECGE